MTVPLPLLCSKLSTLRDPRIDRNESTATAFSVGKAPRRTRITVSSFSSLRPCLVTFVTIYMRQKVKHKLTDVLAIAVCAVMGGAETWEEIQAFAEYKEEWLDPRRKGQSLR